MSRDLTGLRAGQEARHRGELHHGLDDRRRALEEAFFQKQNDELIEALRQQRRHEREVGDLAAECGIHDRRTLDALVDAGIRADTLPALGLTPLIAVAWADGILRDTERDAILEDAASLGVTPESTPYTLLSVWLESAPPPRLFEAWIQYARQLVARLPRWERHHLSDHFLASARRIAEVSRAGTLEPRVSEDQDALLSRIAAILDED